MKLKLALLFTTLIIMTFIGWKFFLANKNQKTTLPSGIQNITPSKAIAGTDKLKEYIDPSGFKFSYPMDLKLQNVVKKEADYYSSIQLKSDDIDGSITIDVTSTKYKSLDEWMKNNEILLKNTKDLKLADLKAKEIKSDGKLIVLAVDVETLFTITANFNKKDEKYWTKATEKLASTFEFQQPETTADSTSQSSEEDVVFEGEEIVE